MAIKKDTAFTEIWWNLSLLLQSLDDHVLHLRILMMVSKNNHKDTQTEDHTLWFTHKTQVRTVTFVSPAACFSEPPRNPPSNVHPNDGSYPWGYDLPCVLHSSMLMARVMPSRRSSRNLLINQVHSQGTWHQRSQDFANLSSLLKVKKIAVETPRLEFRVKSRYASSYNAIHLIWESVMRFLP